jgi:hypothetical protein
MKLDIRLPIGLLFTVVGVVLVVYGLVADSAIYARSLGYNVNAIWGAVLTVFGVVFLVMGRRGTSSVHVADAAGEGRTGNREP